jgi:hypothetical protein
MSDIDQLEQWRLSTQKNSATDSLSQEDDLEQWRLQARQKQQAPTPSPTPNKSPVEALTPVLDAVPVRKFTGRGSSPTGKQVREQTEKRQAQYDADVASGAVIPFEQFAKDDAVFKKVTDFMGVIGKPYDPKKQTREEFVKDFTEDVRFMDTNMVGTAKLLTHLNNNDKAAAAKIATGYVTFKEKLPNAGQRGSEPGMLPALQNIAYSILSPENAASLGLGFIGKSAAKQAGKSALMQKIAGVATAGVMDVAGTAASDATLQKAEQDAQRKRTDLVNETPEEKKARETKPFELDKTRTALVTLVSSVISVGTSAAALKAVDTRSAATKVPLKTRIDAAEGFMGPKLPPAAQKAKQEVIDATNAQIDEEVKRYVQQQGKQVLDELGPESLLADAKIRNNVTQNSVNIAMNIIRDNPDFALKQNEKISDAINRVLSSMNDIPDLTIEAAMRKENVNLEELAAAIRSTTSDAARNLAIMSHASRAMKRLQGIDPTFDSYVKNLYKNTADDTGWGHTIVEGTRRWIDRESKAIVVSGLGTMVSNLAGATTSMAIKPAVRLFGGSVYSIAQAAEALAKGKPVAYQFGKNMANSWEDATRIWKYMADQDLSKDMTELLLKNNPSLSARMLGTGEDDLGISAPARMLNVFNRWQDGIFRRSMFIESIDRQMHDVGFDLMDLMKEGRGIPKDVIARAADDAMKFTMSYMPKTSAKGHFLDAPAEHFAATLVKTVEMIPTGSVWIATFPRFMANASAYYYRHSPLGFASVIGDRGMINRARATGDAATIALAERKARDNAAQAAVGSMMLMAAVAYRADHQETTWDKLENDDGTVTDVKPFFPLAPYLASADVIVKASRGLDFDAKGAIESISGMKLAAGTQDTFIDRLVNVANSDDSLEEFKVQAGKAVGDWAGRYTKGLGMNQIVDLVQALRGDSTVRDPNVLDEKVGGVSVPKWLEAGAQRIQKDIPVAKDELAATAPRFGENDNVTRESEFIGRIIRAKSDFGGNQLVREANRLGLQPFTLFGKPTGDKELDNAMILAINDVAIPELTKIINSPDYKKVSDLNKRERILKDLTDIRERAATVANSNLNETRTFKVKYKALPKRDKQRINEAYRARHPEGKSLEEVDDYRAAEGILAELNAKIGYNKGGFVSRR